MYWPIKDYSINDIFLDTQNIRLQVAYNVQDAILQDLFSNENAMDIVKSIAYYGIFPDEFPTLIEEKGRLVVVEGNRRIAALKAIDNPDRVPLYKSRIKSLKVRRILSIKAVLAPSRSVATTLIANKHVNDLRRPWTPLRQAYFYQSQRDNGKSIEQLKTEFPDHDIIKSLKLLEMHHIAKSITYDDDKIRENIYNEMTFPITNLERMLEDNYVLDYLGLSFDDSGKGEIVTKIDEFKQAYRTIVEDVATGKIDSRKYNNKDQRKSYIDNLKSNISPAKSGKVVESHSLKEVKIEKQDVKPKYRSNRKQKGLIPSYIPYKLDTSILKKIYDELRIINVEKLPNATYELLRVLLECLLIEYLKMKNEYSKIKNSAGRIPKLSEMLNASKNVIKDDHLIEIIDAIKSDVDRVYSLHRMNMGKHNEYAIIEESEVRSAWLKLEPIFKYLLNPGKDE